MREKEVEAHLVARVRAAGGEAYKFTSPARRNVPDRLVLRPIPQEHQAIVARYVNLAEVKAPGKRPTEGQQREHDRLRALGFTVYVFNNPATIDAVYPLKG